MVIVSTTGDSYIEDVWIQKCVLALIFANTIEITNFAILKDSQSILAIWYI